RARPGRVNPAVQEEPDTVWIRDGSQIQDQVVRGANAPVATGRDGREDVVCGPKGREEVHSRLVPGGDRKAPLASGVNLEWRWGAEPEPLVYKDLGVCRMVYCHQPQHIEVADLAQLFRGNEGVVGAAGLHLVAGDLYPVQGLV